MGNWKVESEAEISCILRYLIAVFELRPFFWTFSEKNAFFRLWRRHFRRYAGSMSIHLLLFLSATIYIGFGIKINTRQ